MYNLVHNILSCSRISSRGIETREKHLFCLTLNLNTLKHDCGKKLSRNLIIFENFLFTWFVEPDSPKTTMTKCLGSQIQVFWVENHNRTTKSHFHKITNHSDIFCLFLLLTWLKSSKNYYGVFNWC